LIEHYPLKKLALLKKLGSAKENLALPSLLGEGRALVALILD
jgi:hypothetical protein